MAREKVIAGLDIGNHKVRTVVGVLDPEKGTPNVIGVGMAPSTGMRKGAIIDVEEVIQSISASLEEAERMSGEPIHSVFASVGGTHLEMLHSQGVVAIGGHEITENDVDRVIEAAQTVSMPNNYRLLKIVPKRFTVDNQTNIKYPVGMSGVRLEVDAFIIAGQGPNVNNLEKSINQAGVDIEDLVPVPLAAAEAVIDKRQKELGVVVIDIGAGGTSMVVYEEGMLLHSKVLPVGGESMTNDLAIGLRTAVDTAEKVKIEHGSVDLTDLSDRELIDLALFSKSDNQKVSKRQVGEIVRARLEEIFEMVNEELKAIDRDGKLPAGAVLTGAGVKLPGTVELARDMLKLPVQIGFPMEIDGIVDKIDDPAYATAVGLLVWGSRYEDGGSGFGVGSLNLGKALEGVASFLKNLLPKK